MDSTDKQILASLAKRVKVGVQGAKVSDVLPDLEITRRPAFVRFSRLEADGYIERVEDSDGEFKPTPKGYAEVGE